MTTSTTPTRAAASRQRTGAQARSRKPRPAASAKRTPDGTGEPKAAPVPKRVRTKLAALQNRWKVVLAAAEKLQRNGSGARQSTPSRPASTRKPRRARSS